MPAASATIQAKPFDVRPGRTVTFTTTYIPGTPPGAAVVPNDVHIEYRELNSSDAWTPAYGPTIPGGGAGAGGFTETFTAPTSAQAYDMRVRWTLNGETIAERTGQFRVVGGPSKAKDILLGILFGLAIITGLVLIAGVVMGFANLWNWIKGLF